MPATLVCAVADDDRADDVVVTGRALAGTGDFCPLFVHVVEPRVATPAGLANPPGAAAALAVPRGELDQLIDGACERGVGLLREKGVAEREAVVVVGDPVAELNRLASEHDAALVVAGTRRRGLLASAALGSVSRALARDGVRPVLYAHDAVVPSLGGPVVCGIDVGDVRCGQAAEEAARLAVLMDRPLVLCNVVSSEPLPAAAPPAPPAVLPDATDTQRRRARRALENLARGLPTADVECVVIAGTPHAARLDDFAAGRRADLLVVGDGRKGFLRSVVEGSVSFDLARRGSRPLVVVALG